MDYQWHGADLMGAPQQALLMVSGVVAPPAFIMIPTGANGSSTFTDTGPSPVTITNVGLPTITSNRLVLNGSSTLNAVKDSIFISGGSNFIVKAVFNSANIATDTYICSWRDGTYSPPQWFLSITAVGALNAWDANVSTGAPAVVSSGGFNNGVDHTVIWRKVGTAYTLEVDGSVAASYTGASPRLPTVSQAGRSFCIGGGGAGISASRFIGTMGEVSMTLV